MDSDSGTGITGGGSGYAAILAHAEGALYGMELGSVTLKRIGFFCFPIKHSTHTTTFFRIVLESGKFRTGQASQAGRTPGTPGRRVIGGQASGLAAPRVRAGAAPATSPAGVARAPASERVAAIVPWRPLNPKP